MHLDLIAPGDSRIPDRMWAKVEPDHLTGCWHWIGKTDGYKGTYGGVWYHGKNWRVNRLFYELLVREPLPTEHVHHHCRNRRCVNPAHMDAIAQEDHWGHGHAEKTHCPQGHEYTPENTIVKWRKLKTGRMGPNRLCRACLNARQSARYHAKKNKES